MVELVVYCPVIRLYLCTNPSVPELSFINLISFPEASTTAMKPK